MSIELSSFLSALSRLTAVDLVAIAESSSPATLSADEELASWRSMLSVDHVLRCRGQVRAAGLAAAQARAAVVDAAAALDREVPADVVQQVARSASDIARACVAGPEVGWWMPTVLHGWDGFLARGSAGHRAPAA
jgi:hypothetical protein